MYNWNRWNAMNTPQKSRKTRISYIPLYPRIYPGFISKILPAFCLASLNILALFSYILLLSHSRLSDREVEWGSGRFWTGKRARQHLDEEISVGNITFLGSDFGSMFEKYLDFM